MAPSKIQITTAGASIPQCATNPQLMPFHIEYSGPAPIATFFRVRELKDDSPSSSSSSSSSSSPEGATTNGKEGEAALEKKKTSIGKRLVAAFRGRRIVGVDVPLPEGYMGLILRSEAPGKDKEQKKSALKSNGNGNSRRKTSTRKTRRSQPIEIDSDDDADKPPPDLMDLDHTEDGSLALDAEEVKTLKATQRFDSLMVWNADVAVDEGRDEYIRALREWTAIAADVHRMEE